MNDMEKIEKKLLEEKDFIGIFGVNELKKFFSIKEKEKKNLTVEKLLEMFKEKDAKLSDKDVF